MGPVHCKLLVTSALSCGPISSADGAVQLCVQAMSQDVGTQALTGGAERMKPCGHEVHPLDDVSAHVSHEPWHTPPTITMIWRNGYWEKNYRTRALAVGPPVLAVCVAVRAASVAVSPPTVPRYEMADSVNG